MTERMRRINESVRAVVAEAVGDLKDPRIGIVTVTGVRVSPDLHDGTVYISVFGNKKKQAKALAGLESARGAVQRRLATELRMKRTPQLAFEYDTSVEHAAHITKLIDEVAVDLLPDDARDDSNAD